MYSARLTEEVLTNAIPAELGKLDDRIASGQSGQKTDALPKRTHYAIESKEALERSPERLVEGAVDRDGDRINHVPRIL